MTFRRQKIGRLGEDLARKYLRHKGLTIITSNYQVKLGEIDIVAQERDELVFVEVKTRTSLDHGSPLEAITLRKQRQIRRVAEYYLLNNGGLEQAVRFDVVAILFGDELQIDHIIGAF